MSRTNHRRPRKKKRRHQPRVRTNIARYRCEGCGHLWNQKPGMVDCPKCKCIHVEWLNYDELEQAGMFPEAERSGR
jgi:rubrerythrin